MKPNTTMRFNPDLKSRYDALVIRAKHAKIAITAIMRRLVVIANALLRDNRIWAQKAA